MDKVTTRTGQLEAQHEALLVERSKNNDYSAYELLYQHHVGRVYALCFRLLKDRDLAEDFTQDAFVKAWRSLSGFRGDSAFGSWLYRIATNLVISYLQKENGFGALPEDMLEAEQSTHPGSQQAPVDQISLEQAIARLPDGARAVFILYSIEGYTHPEIAKMTGLAVGSSKAHLHRARTLLQTLLS